MIADHPDAPARLAPFLAEWDYMAEQLLARLDRIADTEYGLVDQRIVDGSVIGRHARCRDSWPTT